VQGRFFQRVCKASHGSTCKTPRRASTCGKDAHAADSTP